MPKKMKRWQNLARAQGGVDPAFRIRGSLLPFSFMVLCRRQAHPKNVPARMQKRISVRQIGLQLIFVTFDGVRYQHYLRCEMDSSIILNVYVAEIPLHESPL